MMVYKVQGWIKTHNNTLSFMKFKTFLKLGKIGLNFHWNGSTAEQIWCHFTKRLE